MALNIFLPFCFLKFFINLFTSESLLDMKPGTSQHREGLLFELFSVKGLGEYRKTWSGRKGGQRGKGEKLRLERLSKAVAESS